MKVHHFINAIGSAPGGAEKIALSLHTGLLDRGIDSRLVSLLDETRAETGFTSLGLPKPYAISAVSRIRDYIRLNCSKGDIIHAHLFPTNLFTGHAARSSGCHVVTTEHSTHNRRREKWWGKFLDRQIYKRYDRIYCISNGTQQALETWIPSLKAKTAIVNNGVELFFENIPEAADNDVPVIVSIGRLHPSKNYETAIRALATLDDESFLYRIAGAGDKELELKKLAADLGLEQKVQFLGYVNSPAELLKTSDLFMITSRWEGFGLAAVEAMNAGLPVIASDIPGLREVVGDSDSGLLVDPTDQDSIANAIRGLLNNSDERSRMRKAAFDRASLFSSTRMVDEYVNQYRTLSKGESV